VSQGEISPIRRVVFGLNPDATDHAFRHIEAIGLNRDAVAAAIVADLMAGQAAGTLLRGFVLVEGMGLDYHAFSLNDEIVNVGRITPRRPAASSG
jgi:hypothetical protein